MDAKQLREIPVFSGLTTEQLSLVAGHGSLRKCGAGEVLFREGEAGTEFFVILEGKVRISKMVPGIGEEALAILEPGAYFGEMALIDNTPRSADAIAHSSCRLWFIETRDLEELMFLNKELAYDLLWSFVRTLAARLRETNDKIGAFFALNRF